MQWSSFQKSVSKLTPKSFTRSTPDHFIGVKCAGVYLTTNVINV